MLFAVRSAVFAARSEMHLVQMATAFYQLSQLLRAGVGLNEALDELGSSSTVRSDRSIWSRVAYGVNGGKNLSDALPVLASKTNNTMVALIRAGEASGNLQQACLAVSKQFQWQYDLRERIITILIYPLFSVCLLLLVTGFLFVSVVPSVEGFLVSAGGVPDWHTNLLIATSAWIKLHYLEILLGSLLFLVGVVSAMSCSQRARRLVERCMLSIPVLGPLLINLSLSRYARSCANLYASGIALEQSLELAEATVSNLVIKSDLRNVRRSMVEGASLAESLSRISILPSMVIRMIHIGESSGHLAEVLNTLGEQLGTAADASIKRMEQLIAPVILMFVGLVLLWIVVSVFAPVYNMAISTVMEAS